MEYEKVLDNKYGNSADYLKLQEIEGSFISEME